MSVGGRHDGVLLVAEINGYAASLTGMDLKHAVRIIEDLAAVVRRSLVPTLELVKRQGGALFFYGDAAQFLNSELLVELTGSCQYDFQARLQQLRRATNCICAACASIGTLDLKFVTRYGDFLAEP